MKPIFFAAAAAGLFAAGAAVADPSPSPDAPLNLLQRNDVVVTFIAPQTVRRDGDKASVWTVLLFKSGNPNLPADFAGGWSLQRFTCSAHIGQTDTADMLNRSLQITQTGGVPRPQQAINPNSPQEYAYRFACLNDSTVIGQQVANLRAAYDLVEH